MKIRRQSTKPRQIASSLRTLFSLAVVGGLIWAPMAQAQTHTIIKHFGNLSNMTGLYPDAPLAQGPDGTLYGTTASGDGSGTVFKIQPDGTGFATLKCFINSAEGAYPRAGVALSGGTLYGTTGYGGPSNAGTVFKVNTDGTGYTVLKAFAGTDEGYPYAGLVVSDGTLYGTTFGTTVEGGGTIADGTVFKINTDGTGYTVLKRFTSTSSWSDGRGPYAGLVLSGGALYGTTKVGGGSGYGVVFKVNTDGTGFTVLKSFTGSDGKHPQADLLLSGSTLYGTTYWGGSSGYGVVFKVNTDGTGFTVLRTFTGSGGTYPSTGLVLCGGTLYGTTCYGGSSGKGTVFKVNTDGTGSTVVRSFTGGSDGAQPRAGLVLSGTTLYGTTSGDGLGSSGSGTVFKLNTTGAGYAVLKRFGRSDAAMPWGGRMVVSGTTLYGTCLYGGSSNLGTVFKVNTDGTGYTVLKSFTGRDGESPRAGLVLSGGTLYGTTYQGGSFGHGTVFKLNTDGTGYTVLKNFTQIHGGWPQADLVLSGNTLYGTTWDSSCADPMDHGTVFKLNTDGTGYTVLRNFAGSDGSNPYAGLVLSGNTLYGTTTYGGSSGYGTVFKVNTNGTGHTVLKSFTGSDGQWPWAALVLSGSTLYGTTYSGGSSNAGTAFKLNTDGTGFAVLKNFTGRTDGQSPYTDLVLSGSTLYGTTREGGALGNGTVFRIDLSGGMSPVIDGQPQGRVNRVGSTPGFSVTVIGTAPLTYQWRKDGIDLADGAQSSGATISGTWTSGLTIANVQMSDAGEYTVVVTNAYGSVTSAVAALTVELPVLTADGSGSSGTNGFGFNLSGMTGQTVVIEGSTNLTSWTPLLTNSPPIACFHFNDCDWTNFIQRFYRARLTPQ